MSDYLTFDQTFPLDCFYIHLKEVWTKEECKYYLDRAIEENKWEQGGWYNYGKDVKSKNSHDRAIFYKEFMEKSLVWREAYLEKTGIRIPVGFHNVPTINRYKEGDSMGCHVDHIHSLFDGKNKGIPIATTLGILNDDFDGGDFVFWEDKVIHLEPGDLLAFPSNFLYPHRVTPVEKGTRYSWISWWF